MSGYEVKKSGEFPPVLMIQLCFDEVQNSACCEEFRFICRRGSISELCIEVESNSVMW